MKAKIVRIGTVDENGVPQDWKFDCSNGATPLKITSNGVLYGGYSVAELRGIAAKQAEHGKMTNSEKEATIDKQKLLENLQEIHLIVEESYANDQPREMHDYLNGQKYQLERIIGDINAGCFDTRAMSKAFSFECSDLIAFLIEGLPGVCGSGDCPIVVQLDGTNHNTHFICTAEELSQLGHNAASLTARIAELEAAANMLEYVKLKIGLTEDTPNSEIAGQLHVICRGYEAHERLIDKTLHPRAAEALEKGETK